MYYAFGVLCRGICMRHITLASCVTLLCSCGVRNTRCTHVIAKRCKETYGRPRKSTLTVVFLTVGHTSGATLSERFWCIRDPLHKPQQHNNNNNNKRFGVLQCTTPYKVLSNTRLQYLFCFVGRRTFAVTAKNTFFGIGALRKNVKKLEVGKGKTG